MKSLPATAFNLFALGFLLVSNAPAQESTRVKASDEGVTSGPADVLPVAEAKKRYLESQKQLDDLAKGGWTSDQVVGQRVMRLDVARVQEPRERLRAAVAAAYDARRQLQQAELAELERRLANIKRALAVSDAMKETIIDQRTDELLDKLQERGGGADRERTIREYPDAKNGVAIPPGEGSSRDVRTNEGRSELDPKGADVGVTEAERELAAAKQAYNYSKKMHAKGYVTQADVDAKSGRYDRAKIELQRAAADAETNRRLAELDVEEAEADFAAAERDYLRVSAAHESGTVTQEVFDKAENKCRHAKIELERARLKLEAFGGTSSTDVRDTDPAPAAGAATGEEPPIMWGQPVGWMQLGWHVEPRSNVYHLGDVLTFGLIIRNAGKSQVQWTFPRTQVLEKLGFDLTLRDAEAVELRHFWGPAHFGKDKVLEVSGYNAASFEPGGTHELAVIKLLVGRGKTPGSAGHDPSIFAKLDVTPGQTAQLWFNLSPREGPSGDEVKLQSVPFMFRVEPRR